MSSAANLIILCLLSINTFAQRKEKCVITHSEFKETKFLKNGKDTIILEKNDKFCIDPAQRYTKIRPVFINAETNLIESDFVKNFIIVNPQNNHPLINEFAEEDYFVSMVPLVDTTKTKVLLKLNPVNIKIAEGTLIGRERGKKILKEVSTQLFDPVFGTKKSNKTALYNALLKSPFQLDLDNHSRYEEFFIEPKVILEATITNFYFRKFTDRYADFYSNPSDGGKYRDLCTGKLEVTWTATGGDKIIAKDTLSVVESNLNADVKSLFERLLVRSAQSFLFQESTYRSLNEFQQKAKEDYISKKIVLPGNDSLYSKNKFSLKDATKAVVLIEDRKQRKFGSGFLISKEGHILTNYHVIKETEKPVVKFKEDTNTYTYNVLRIDPENDIALIKVDTKNRSHLRLDESQNYEIGESVFAIGNPAFKELAQTVTKGIISGVRKLDNNEFIQSDVAVNPGNSGGPLINENGKVLGVITSNLSPIRGFQGVCFIVPANVVLKNLGLEIK